MLEEVKEKLHLQKGMVVVDATLGGGGHASMMLTEVSPTGKLIAFDADQGALQGVGDPVDHLEAEILAARLDPVDGALAGAEFGGQLLLGEPALLARVPNQSADAARKKICHADDLISHKRWAHEQLIGAWCDEDVARPQAIRWLP